MTSREKAENIIQYNTGKDCSCDMQQCDYCKFVEDFEQALTEARLEGAKDMRERAAELVEVNHGRDGDHPFCDSEEPCHDALAIRELKVKGEK